MAWTDLKERDVSRQVSDFLKYRGWRRIRNQVSLSTNLVTGNVVASGEKGMADLLFLLYIPAHKPWTMALWIETKRPRGKLSPHQVAWQNEERLRGALVYTADCFETFAEWYERELGWLHSAAGPQVPGNLGLFAGDRSPPE